ncbi:MobA-like NTP transferase domain-containing protein [Thalassovita taeanensis]|uniref:MobA-like NTP transferase domain-containing protein n=2 Tax=Thalassovita taeanensis TaxID=657014 RepID=A0A1H9JI24_9RHOB|nr:MobA-like NTP transferase domain-containing protein [Thalassovita taeanensis]
MLFAAGFGTRMGALTAEQPKPMIPVAGKPLIDHALGLVDDYAPARAVVNLHYKPKALINHLAGRNVDLSLEEPEILETGGGLRAALPKLGTGPVFTMNTDAVWLGPNPLRLLEDAWNPEVMDALLICIPRENAVGHAGTGDFLSDPHGRLTRGPGQVYGGVQILKTDELSKIKDTTFSLNLLWNRMLDEGRLFGLSYPGNWCDVGRPEGIALAEKMIGYTGV